MIKSLFPTLIWQASLAPPAVFRRLNRELLKDTEILMGLDEAGWKWSKENYLGGYTSYGSKTKLHRQNAPFIELSNRIDRQVKAFTRRLGWKALSLEMTDCWVNVMPLGVHHSLHLHPRSVLSGTYYVDIPEGAGPIKFEDPRLGLMMNAPAREVFYRVDPKPGQLLMWESWLRHEVPANQIGRAHV